MFNVVEHGPVTDLISIHHLPSLLSTCLQVCSTRSSLQCLRSPRSRIMFAAAGRARSTGRITMEEKETAERSAVTSSQKSTTSGHLDASASQRSRRQLNRRTQSSSSCSALGLARSRHRRADIAEHTNTHCYTHLLQLICYATKDELRSPKHRKTGSSRSRPKPISHHPRWVVGSGAGSP